METGEKERGERWREGRRRGERDGDRREGEGREMEGGVRGMEGGDMEGGDGWRGKKGLCTPPDPSAVLQLPGHHGDPQMRPGWIGVPSSHVPKLCAPPERGLVGAHPAWGRGGGDAPSRAVYSLSSMRRARPKSAILQPRVSDTRMLAARRSRWM